MHDGALVAVKLRDRKTVSFLSTVHNMDMVDTGKRGYDGERIRKFSIVNSYKFMGAVDTSHQMCQYSSFLRRTNKWWKRVFFHLVNLAIVNAFILYKEHCKSFRQKPKLQREFCVGYAKALVEDAGHLPITVRRPGRQPEMARLLRRLTPHVPKKIESATGAKRRARLCAACNAAERQMQDPGECLYRKESTIECKACHKALCIVPCFGLFHEYTDAVSAYKRMKRANDQWCSLPKNVCTCPCGVNMVCSAPPGHQSWSIPDDVSKLYKHARIYE